MKKINLLLIALLSFSLVSCDDDDDSETTLEITVANLIGSYTLDEIKLNDVRSPILEENHPESITFATNGVATFDGNSGTWTFNEETKFIQYGYTISEGGVSLESSFEDTVMKLSDSELKMENVEGELKSETTFDVVDN